MFCSDTVLFMFCRPAEHQLREKSLVIIIKSYWWMKLHQSFYLYRSTSHQKSSQDCWAGPNQNQNTFSISLIIQNKLQETFMKSLRITDWVPWNKTDPGSVSLLTSRFTLKQIQQLMTLIKVWRSVIPPTWPKCKCLIFYSKKIKKRFKLWTLPVALFSNDNIIINWWLLNVSYL